jgi:pimeloyl-ACP methyl ester carboxylesterase
VILPGLGNSAADYYKFAELLQDEYECDVEVADVARVDWLRNAAGLTDVRYWKGTLPPRPTVDWYLDKITAAVKTLEERGHTRPAAMISHSAGGWLARVFLHDYGAEGFDRLISLGSPHLPPPKDIPGTVDQTRGILQFCDETFPSCHHEEVKYTTVAGKFVQGVKWGDEGTWQQRVAGAGYKQVR